MSAFRLPSAPRLRSARPLSLAGAVMLALCTLLSAGPASAQHAMVATWCDAPEQVERLTRLQDEQGLSHEAAAAMVNREVKIEHACAAMIAVGTPLNEIKRFSAGSTLYAIVQVDVIGIVQGSSIVLTQPIVWYVARPVARLVSI